MCTDHDSHPPIQPISGAALDGSSMILRGEDGARFRAYLAKPEQGTGAGVLILPDVRGLHPFFEELAMRFAERGIVALAIDYFGRTAGTAERGGDFEYMPHVDRLQWDSLRGDVKAGVTHLRSVDPAPRSVVTTGFCLGGRLSSLSATLGLGLAGAIPFYGWPVGPGRGGTPAPVDLADKIECDMLPFYGGADEGVPDSARIAFDKALDKAGVRHETVVYPNAPHGFFDKKAEEFAEESADAWDKVLAFIRRHTMGQPIAASPGKGRTTERATEGAPRDDGADAQVEDWIGDE